jgi:mannitol/fructose-specific phosphotransferase system IIA component (Ntr-type)
MIDLKTLLPVDHVVLPVTGDGQREIFEHLVSPLCTKGIVSDQKVFLDALVEREAQVTTQVENNVAIPHARSRVVKRLGLALGIAPPPGLPFDPDRKAPCRLFFLIAIPAFAPTAHLPLLKKLANFAHDPQRIEKLLDTSDLKKLVRQITTFKG